MKDKKGNKVATKAGEVIPSTQEPATALEVGRTVANFDDYTKELELCIQDGKKLFPDDFFIEVSLSKTIWQKVLKNNFKARLSCPTPNYDQTVWRYNDTTQQVEYIWTIPDRNTCMFMYMNKEKIDNSQKELLQFVLDFSDGTLLRRCKQFNNEDEKESPLIIIKKE